MPSNGFCDWLLRTIFTDDIRHPDVIAHVIIHSEIITAAATQPLFRSARQATRTIPGGMAGFYKKWLGALKIINT
jgi:hypothetical protein